VITPAARGRWLLAVAMAIGATLVALGIVDRAGPPAAQLPDDAVAMVNNAPIARGDYRRALKALAAARRSNRLTAADRERVLQRLIDEELLIQRGLELGLASRDTSVRAALSRAMIDMLVARAQLEQRDVTDDALRGFYRDHRAYFRRAPRLSVRDVTAAGSVVSLPAGLVPAAKLRDYIGGAAVARLAAADVGDTVQVGDRRYRLVDRRRGDLPAFARVRNQVLAEYRRRAADTLLRQTLDERHRRAAITIARDRL